MTIAKNDLTAKFGRQNRFLIDDPESPVVLAYSLTKPFKLGGTYNGRGVFKFVLQEVTTTDDDNQQLCIADYYKHFPKTEQDVTTDITSDDSFDEQTNIERTVWL